MGGMLGGERVWDWVERECGSGNELSMFARLEMGHTCVRVCFRLCVCVFFLYVCTCLYIYQRNCTLCVCVLVDVCVRIFVGGGRGSG